MAHGAEDHQHGHDHGHDHDHDHHHAHLTEFDTDLRGLGFDAFGLGMTVSVPAAVVPRVHAVLPPGAQIRDPRAGDEHFMLSSGPHDEFWMQHGAKAVAASSDLQVALEVVAQRIREFIAENADGYVFVHAGAVGHAGRAIIIPGMTFSGKTTLTAELVKAGATYYSDEYAVLDSEGRLHPYAKPLSLRLGAGYEQTDHDVSAIGGTQGVEPLPVGMVVFSWYEIGAEWAPEQLSTGEAIISMIANTIPVSDRDGEPLATITAALRGSVALRGPRGDAAAMARELLSVAVS
jgi:hypothetical protein